MRYAHGIVTGAIFPLIIFFVATVINVAGIGADPTVLEILWGIYIIWFMISIGIAIIPPIVVRIGRKEMFREFVIYEAGGFGVFTPIWVIFFTDLSGDSWTKIFTEGINNALIAPGLGGLIGIDVSSTFLIPFFIFSFLAGVFVLRPSFIQKYGTVEPTELTALKSDAAPVTPTKDPIEAEMPDVAPPPASAASIADLKSVLTELGVDESVINQILSSGIATTEDFVATSADHLATITGLDKRKIEEIHMAVQKKAFFGGI
ncbi:MAG: helix-hairpin-helix domain-containing protein [Candidatus Thorarchaeota archaeon]